MTKLKKFNQVEGLIPIWIGGLTLIGFGLISVTLAIYSVATKAPFEETLIHIGVAVLVFPAIFLARNAIIAHDNLTDL